MIGNVKCLAAVLSSQVLVQRIACARREEVGVVSLPEADVDVEGGGKC